MATLAERAQSKFSEKAARYADPLTLAGAVIQGFSKPADKGASEWLPAGPGINAAASDPRLFYLASNVANPLPGQSLVWQGRAYTIVDAWPESMQGIIVYWAARAYRTPQNAPDISTDPQAALYGTPPTRP